MAVLKNVISSEIIQLNRQHVFGSNKYHSQTYIDGKDISQTHVVFYWKSPFWYAQDHSEKGTLINDILINNTTLKLNLGDKLKFGISDDSSWILMDVSEPKSYLISTLDPNKTAEIALVSNFNSPSTVNLIFKDYIGRYENIEYWGDISDFKIGDTYKFNGDNWLFIKNDSLADKTEIIPEEKECYFIQFSLGKKTKHIQIKLKSDNQEIDLGDRKHNFLLLILAKQYIFDSKAGYCAADIGWLKLDTIIEFIFKQDKIEIDMYYLNLLIYRLRKYLISFETAIHSKILIERKNKEIRIVYSYFQIIENNKITNELMPISCLEES